MNIKITIEPASPLEALKLLKTICTEPEVDPCPQTVEETGPAPAPVEAAPKTV